MKKYFLITSFCTAIFLISACSHTPADSEVDDDKTAAANKALTLQKIMQDLGTNMQTISDGISREDWALVEKNARQVADHPRPSMDEKKRIMAYMGDKMATFKGYDIKTHNAARELSTHAAQKNGDDIITAFAALQKTCLACHENFRQDFQQHFHAQP